MATDGMITEGPYPETKEVLGGFAIVDVASREEALAWAAKIAVGGRSGRRLS
ncbi:YciI family protein [Micromonospora sp. NPDC093243]|uniref:YciI family protein n=1 Tax=Micromonospora sp. NPDC093243 TaxID=3364290 RepID=UPI0038145634